MKFTSLDENANDSNKNQSDTASVFIFHMRKGFK